MMKVLLISNYKKGTGGISGQVELLHQHLNNEGIETSIYNTKGSVFYRIKSFFKLFKVANDFNVIHAHGCSSWGFLPIVYSVIIGKKLHKRVIVTYHGGGADDFFEKHPKFVKYFLKRTDANIVLSGFLGKVFDKYDIPYTVIPNIIEMNESHFKERQKITPKFVSIRTLFPLYNIECILRAFKKVKSVLQEATLTIVGDGPSRQSLEKMVQDDDIQDVVFVGRVDNSKIYGYLDKSDMMLSAPRVDNMPVSILEGFNAGLLVISSRVGGVPYMIEDGVNGLLFESDDDKKLAEKMLWAVNNNELSAEIIKTANKSLNDYTWDSIKEKLFNLYSI